METIFSTTDNENNVILVMSNLILGKIKLLLQLQKHEIDM